MWGTQTYYIRKPEYKDAFYGIPERATVYDIDWYCNEYEYDFDKFVDAYFDVDDRTDEEIVRDKVRPAKDIVLEMNNYLSQYYRNWDNVDYDKVYANLERIMDVEKATVKELFDINDYSKIWFKSRQLEYEARNDEEGAKEMVERRIVIEDVLYDRIYETVQEVMRA